MDLFSWFPVGIKCLFCVFSIQRLLRSQAAAVVPAARNLGWNSHLVSTYTYLTTGSADPYINTVMMHNWSLCMLCVCACVHAFFILVCVCMCVLCCIFTFVCHLSRHMCVYYSGFVPLGFVQVYMCNVR